MPSSAMHFCHNIPSCPIVFTRHSIPWFKRCNAALIWGEQAAFLFILVYQPVPSAVRETVFFQGGLLNRKCTMLTTSLFLSLSLSPSLLPPNMFHIVSLNRVDSGNAVTLSCLSKIPGWGLAQCDGGSADPGSWASLCRVSSSWENRCPRRQFLQVICRMVCSLLLLLCNAIFVQIRCSRTTG